MAALRYDPVVGPQVGNAASAVNDAARNVSAGLSALGSGLTNLGERQEKRVELANQKREAQIKNAVALYAEMAPDEAALQSLMGDVTNYVTQPGAPQDAPASIIDKVLGRGSVSPTALGADVDFASMFSNRRNNMLVDESTRAGIRSTDASTAGQLTENAIKNLELEDKNLENAWNTEFGADLNRAASLAAEGKIDEARAIESEVLLKAGSRYGSRPDDFFKRSFDLLTAGDNARSGVTKNALDIEGARLGNDLTGEQIANAQQARAIAASTEADRDRMADVEWKIKSKAFDTILKDETTNSRLNTIVDNAYGIDHAIELVELQTDLTPEQRNTMKQGLYTQVKEDPEFFKKMNPSTRTSVQDPDNPDLFDADIAVKSIIDRTTRELQTGGSLAIFSRAEAYSKQFNSLDGKIADFGSAVAERFPNRKVPDAIQTEILKLKTASGNGYRDLTDAEMLAILDDSLGRKSTGFLGIGGGPAQIAPDVGKIRSIAKEYAKQDPSNFVAESARTKQYAERAVQLKQSIDRMEQELIGALDAKDKRKEASLRAMIADAKAEIAATDLELGKEAKKREKKDMPFFYNGLQ